MGIDYKEYEDKVRKVDSEYMRSILKKYVSHYSDRKRVLDIACGKGDFLSLAKEAGINAIGIDNDPSIVIDATSRGLTIHGCDAFEFLENNREPFDGIFCSQFIEHLGPNDLLRLLTLIHRNLTDDGFVILTTPNPQSLIVHLQSFYKDFSHVRFYDLELIKFMMEHAKFKVIDAGLDQDTAFPMPLMTIGNVEINNISLSTNENSIAQSLENVPTQSSLQIDGTFGPVDLNSSSDYRLNGISKDIHGPNPDAPYNLDINKLKPSRQKGLFNYGKYLMDIVIYRFIRRYLFGIYGDMSQYNKAMLKQRSQLIENQDLLLKLLAQVSKLNKADMMLQQQLIQSRNILISQEEQLKKENEALYRVIELLKTNEAAYNGFITSVYKPHDIYIKGIKTH